jgi:predicted NUDIX family phosphoesterase
MRAILVVERKHLFPGLSPQGFLPSAAVNLDDLYDHFFFAERAFMETNSHFKQIIPYLVLTRGRGEAARVLAYQRRQKHTEARLGGLWSVGFGGHVEPLDRGDEVVAAAGLVRAAAVRELVEETGVSRATDQIVLAGYINSDREDVSSVHFGVVFRVPLDDLAADDAGVLASVAAQSEPHQARWIPAGDLRGLVGDGRGPDAGTFEDWSRIAIDGLAIR